jgi:hypothetical protein
MSELFARCEGCGQAINYGEGIAVDGRLHHKRCVQQVSTEPQGPARAGQEPGETGGSRNAGSQAGEAQSVRPSWLFPFPMEYKGRRKPDAQEDGAVREGDFFEHQRSER